METLKGEGHEVVVEDPIPVTVEPMFIDVTEKRTKKEKEQYIK